MSKMEKIKRITLIALGFGLATYLIMSGMAILDAEEAKSVEVNATKLSHSQLNLRHSQLDWESLHPQQSS
jgi:hypothetical protein